ncbi:hypothetical protein ACFWMJ_17000 [Streptomyces hawaiiensis]|uniref:hypothetical protein n=1 Tax=Streptomyces hawaiiensis TaxID=67305 RepID=UPI00366516D6
MAELRRRHPRALDVTVLTEMLGAMVPATPQSEEDALTRWLDEQESVVHMEFGPISRLTRSRFASPGRLARRLEGRRSLLWKLPKAHPDQLSPDADLPADLAVHTRTFNAAEVTAKLNRVLTEDSFSERARHWAGRQHEADGVVRAADLLVDYVETCAPGERPRGRNGFGPRG